MFRNMTKFVAEEKNYLYNNIIIMRHFLRQVKRLGYRFVLFKRNTKRYGMVGRCVLSYNHTKGRENDT